MHGKMNHVVIKRTATTLLVEDLHLYERHISTISLEAFRILNSRKFQLVRRSNRLYLIAAGLLACRIGHGLNLTRLELHILESEKPLIGAFALAY